MDREVVRRWPGGVNIEFENMGLLQELRHL